MMNKSGTFPTLSLLEELLDIPSPSGREAEMAQLVQDKLRMVGYTPEMDLAGNVIVRLDGQTEKAPLCCLAAHMDEIGMVVTRVQEDGSLLVNRSGGLYPWKLGEKPVEILGDHQSINGVASMGSTHREIDPNRLITWSDVKVITGLTAEALQSAGVRPGSAAVPTREVRGPVVFGDPDDPLVGAWTLDDRMGVIILLQLMEKLAREGGQPQSPTLIAFTVAEEVGGHGAKSLAQRERPDIFIAVDGCPMPPGTSLQLDSRPGIWSKDRIAHYDQGLILELSRAAKQAGIALQPVVYERAASDAGLVYGVGAVQKIACIGHVRENSHGFEVARLSTAENVVNTLLAYLT
jgi:putative aminopeptidase FrvX